MIFRSSICEEMVQFEWCRYECTKMVEKTEREEREKGSTGEESMGVWVCVVLVWSPTKQKKNNLSPYWFQNLGEMEIEPQPKHNTHRTNKHPRVKIVLSQFRGITHMHKSGRAVTIYPLKKIMSS